MRKERRNTILWVLFHAFFLQVTVATARPVSSYLAIDLDAGPLILAMIVATFSILPIFLAMPLGRLVDQGKSNSILFCGASLILISVIGLRWFSDTITQLLLWNAVMGLGLVACLLGEHKIVAKVAGAKLDRAFGLYTTAAAVAHMVGPLALGVLGGGGIIPNSGPVLLFMLVTSILLLATTFPLFASKNSARTLAVVHWKSAFEIERPVRRGLSVSIILSMVVLTALDLLQVYLPAMAVDRNLNVETVGLVLMLRSFGTAISRFGLSLVIRFFGRTPVLLSTVVASGIFMIIIAMPIPSWSLYIVAVVLGAMLGIGQPISMATIGLYAPKKYQGTWFALRLTGSRLGQVSLPLILTLVTGGSGATAVLVGSGVLLLLASGVSGKSLCEMDRITPPGQK